VPFAATVRCETAIHAPRRLWINNREVRAAPSRPKPSFSELLNRRANRGLSSPFHNPAGVGSVGEIHSNTISFPGGPDQSPPRSKLQNETDPTDGSGTSRDHATASEFRALTHSNLQA